MTDKDPLVRKRCTLSAVWKRHHSAVQEKRICSSSVKIKTKSEMLAKSTTTTLNKK